MKDYSLSALHFKQDNQRFSLELHTRIFFFTKCFVKSLSYEKTKGKDKARMYWCSQKYYAHHDSWTQFINVLEKSDGQFFVIADSKG